MCALANQLFQNSLESQGLDPLQKRTVWSSFLNTFCVLWGGVHRTSNVRKCRFNNIQLYRLNFGLKGFLDSSQPEFLSMFCNPMTNSQANLRRGWFGGPFGHCSLCAMWISNRMLPLLSLMYRSKRTEVAGQALQPMPRKGPLKQAWMPRP